jgi:hypothetical protein
VHGTRGDCPGAANERVARRGSQDAAEDGGHGESCADAGEEDECEALRPTVGGQSRAVRLEDVADEDCGEISVPMRRPPAVTR